MDEQYTTLLDNTVPLDAACKTCRWWATILHRQTDIGDNPRIGQCHRRAPVVVPFQSTTATCWPETLAYAVCGEWEAGE